MVDPKATRTSIGSLLNAKFLRSRLKAHPARPWQLRLRRDRAKGGTIADMRGDTLFNGVQPDRSIGRIVHVRFKIVIDGQDMLTGRMDFPDMLGD
jgi:protocatechuate 3,4-dioxygenase beta subunit